MFLDVFICMSLYLCLQLLQHSRTHLFEIFNADTGQNMLVNFEKDPNQTLNTKNPLVSTVPFSDFGFLVEITPKILKKQ